eukprot:6323891-Amphidinium_carterae.1
MEVYQLCTHPSIRESWGRSESQRLIVVASFLKGRERNRESETDYRCQFPEGTQAKSRVRD